MTEPPPVGVALTVNVCWTFVKSAVTALLESMVTVQEPEPVQAPAQPLKLHPSAGAAATVTGVP